MSKHLNPHYLPQATSPLSEALGCHWRGMGHPVGLGTRAAPAAPSEPRAPPTWDATVRRGFSSADSSLGISFITMATALSAALAPLPYNSETNNGAKSAAGSDRLPRTRPSPAGRRPRLRLEAKLGWKQNTHTHCLKIVIIIMIQQMVRQPNG